MVVSSRRARSDVDARNVSNALQSKSIASPAADPPTPPVTVAEGMRFYEAIIGRAPTVDPQAPDLLPRLRDDEPPASNWREKLSRQVRDELGRTLGGRLHVRFDRRPSWRELGNAMTRIAGRRLQEARGRLQRENRLAGLAAPRPSDAAPTPTAPVAFRTSDSRSTAPSQARKAA